MPDVTVFCCVCGTPFCTSNPAIEYRSLDRRWWCTDEIACIMRASISEQSTQDWMADTGAMQRALDGIWATLDADGWKL